MAGRYLVSFFSQDLLAQEVITTKSYKIQQEKTVDDVVTIKGIVRVKQSESRWQRGKRVEIFIYSSEELLVKKIKTGLNGRFSVRLPKDVLGQEFRIKAVDEDYINVAVDNLLGMRFK